MIFCVFVDCLDRIFFCAGLLAYLLIVWVVFFCAVRIFLADGFLRVLPFFGGSRILGIMYLVYDRIFLHIRYCSMRRLF